MHLIFDYDVYIFDCDGVVLDSNLLKIKAMESALLNFNFSQEEIRDCLSFFKSNFGLSRYKHIGVFLERFLSFDLDKKNYIYNKLLFQFSESCKSLYAKADLTEGFINFIENIQGECYIASGSDQEELRGVFHKRGLENYFSNIYGSPVSKSENISKITKLCNGKRIIMLGDSRSDFDAAQANNIDFIGYLPYSNVKKDLLTLSKRHGFSVLTSWPGGEYDFKK